MSDRPILVRTLQREAAFTDKSFVRQVRVMPETDVHAARESDFLRRTRRTLGQIAGPVVPLLSGRDDRRSCRSCGFQVGGGDPLLSFSYTWRFLDDPREVVVHDAPCRHGAAHALVIDGSKHLVRGEALDEVERSLLSLRVAGLSDRQIATCIGSTQGSVAAVLVQAVRRCRLLDDRHILQQLEAIERSERATASDQLDAMLDELTV